MTYTQTTNGDETTLYEYDDSGQLTNIVQEISGPNSASLQEIYDPNWKMTSASQSWEIDSGGQTVLTSIAFDANWTMVGASVYAVSDTDADNNVFEAYDANWHMISATVSSGYKSGQTDTRFTNNYDGNWNLTSWDVDVSVTPSTDVILNTGTQYNSSGAFVDGSAEWSIRGAVYGFESWTTGTHQVTLTETPNAGSTTPLDRVVDIAYDAAGQMTGAKILTYGIQGQWFTSTEEDYDATWHLTSWHGDNLAYGASVNYTV